MRKQNAQIKDCPSINLGQKNPLAGIFLVGVAGIEPATFCVSCKRSSQVSYTPVLADDKWRVARGSRAEKEDYYFFEFISSPGSKTIIDDRQ